MYDDEKDLMFCSWCLEAKKKNPYANSGSNNFQKSALDRHGNLNPEHLQIVQAKAMQTSKSTVNCMMDQYEMKNSTLSHESKVFFFMHQSSPQAFMA